MTLIGPYRLLRTLGTSPVGSVWSAFDEEGTSVTVAVIDAAHAADLALLSGFEAGTNSLARTGELSVVNVDLTPPTPWVACAWDGGIGAAKLFIAQGLTYTPTPVGGSASAEKGKKAKARKPAPAAAPPVVAPVATPAAAPPVVAPPVVVPVVPASPAVAATGSVTAVPVVAVSPPAPPTVDIPATPAPDLMASEVWKARKPSKPPKAAKPPKTPKTPKPSRPPKPEKPRRGRRWAVAAAAMAVFLVAGGIAALAVYRVRQQRPSQPTDAGTFAPAANGPGLEPPSEGDWPALWPEFGRDDKTQKLSNLTGIGFTFRVPEDWKCTLASSSSDEARYTCGVALDTNHGRGGDIIVRDCKAPCDGRRRVEMRQSEEAWGLQWIRAGGYMAWAETTNFTGSPHYGLVVVGYWRSVQDAAIDKQVVVRLIAPADQKDEIRKVANDIRAAVR